MAPVRSSGFVDPGWEHGVAQDEKKKKVKCNYCGKIVSGGIYRLKQHLARVSGEVTYCNKAPEEVYLRMNENLEGCRLNKKPRHSLPDNSSQPYLNFHTNDDEEREAHHNQNHNHHHHHNHNQLGYRSKGKQLMEERSSAAKCSPLRSLGYVDPGWEHCIAQDERKKKVKCNYCEKIVSGGINRFKQHLARIPGEVAACKHAPEEVFLKMKDNMKWHRTGRKQKRVGVNEIPSFYTQSDSEEEEDEDEEEEEEEEEDDEDGDDEERVEADLRHINKEKFIDCDRKLGKDSRRAYKGVSVASCSKFLRRSRLDSVFMNTFMGQTPEPYRQPKVSKQVANKKSRKEVISAICRFFYYAGVPLQAANSVYFHKMLELVGLHGEGLVGLTSQLLSGRFLQEEISSIRNSLVEYKASWAISGCTIVADSWRDTHGKLLINFLASGPNGTYFVSSTDAVEVVDDGFSLFKLLDKVVEEIGEENVVQVITRNTQSYRAAGKMLEEKRMNLFWTPCAVDCIDHMLEDILKIRIVGECMEKGKKITKLIYNHIWLLNFMKSEFTLGKELLRPAVMRCASSFATLQSLVDHRIGLRRLFQSSKWVSSKLSKSSEGKEAVKIVLSSTFWKRAHFVVKSVDPIIQVLQKVDSGESVSMPFIYHDMYRAKLAIKSIHGDDACKYSQFLDVVESHWNSSFYHPIYMAAHFLNPSYRYQPDFATHTEVVRGLNECIARLEPDTAKRVSASMQLSDYNSAKADFGTELAVSTRTELPPAAWWQQHGISCLELQRIAVRVLSQSCSSIGCEHDWNGFDQMHRHRHNRVAHKRLEELIYVHYNLRLREGKFRKRTNSLTSPDNLLIERLLDDWTVDKERRHSAKDEEILINEMEVNLYEDETIDYEDGNVDTGKGVELSTSADVNFTPVNITAGCSDDDYDDGDGEVNYFDEDLSD